MTNQPEIKPCRAAFEAWYDTTPSRALNRKDDGYVMIQTQLSWAAWQAAWNTRAEPAAPLPDGIQDEICSAEKILDDEFGPKDNWPFSFDKTRAHIAALEADLSAYVDESFERSKEIERLREALDGIATTSYCVYDGNRPYVSDHDSGYAMGVADGHRLAAKWAQEALAHKTDGKAGAE